MYSQQELDDAVASGVITAEAADALRAHIERQRTTSIPDEEQFRLITGFNDIFVSIAAAILLFAVGWIGQSIGQAAGMFVTDHGDVGPSFLAPLAIAATAWGLALFFTGRAGWRCRRSCSCWRSSAACSRRSAFLMVQVIGADRFNDSNDQLLAATVGGYQRGDRRRRRLASLAPFPRADHRRRGRRCRSRPVPRGRRRHRPARRQRQARRTSSSASCCCSASACSCSRCGGIPPTARASRAAPTSPSGCTCSRRR